MPDGLGGRVREAAGDAGDVHEGAGGEVEVERVDVRGGEGAARAAGAVVRDGGAAVGADVLDQQAGGAVGVDDRADGHALGPQLADDAAGERVGGHPAGPGDRDSQVGEGHGDVGLGTARADGHLVGPPELLVGTRPEDGEPLADGDDALDRTPGSTPALEPARDAAQHAAHAVTSSRNARARSVTRSKRPVATASRGVIQLVLTECTASPR
jgi:hypothetical protein